MAHVRAKGCSLRISSEVWTPLQCLQGGVETVKAQRCLRNSKADR